MIEQRKNARNGIESGDQTTTHPDAATSNARDSKTASRPRLRFGVVGYGYWGPQLVRNLDRLTMGEVAYIADLSEERRQSAQFEFPATTVTAALEDVLASDVDALIIATPIRTHYNLARQALERGKHVFVEKPLTANSTEAEDLVALANRLGRVLMVGHTFMYNPAVEKLRSLVQDGDLGHVYYIDALRVNLGLFQPDINVMWDLAPHDLSILNYVLDMHPVSVSAQGGSYVRPNVHDVVYLTLKYPNGLLAHIHVSWLNPSKMRRFTVVGDKQMAIYDDVEATEKIRVFNRGVDAPERTSTFGEFQLSYRYGDIVSPHIRWSEPLAVECRHFAESILEGKNPRSDGRNGLSIVQILEAAEASLAAGGATMPVPSPNV